MSYFIFNRANGHFVAELEDILLVRFFPANEYEVVISIHGY